MPDVVVANHIFLPWVQPGVAANIPATSADKLGLAVQPSVLTMQVGVTVNTEAPVTKTMRLYGPGDVTGVDPHQVVRTDPKPRTTDFEPNYFAAIEFDRPDLPWLFTPAKAETQGKLRPWMCLVVVRKQEGVELKPPAGGTLPSLNIMAPAKPADELPDLLESWAWAHVQLTGTEKTRIKDALDTDPTRNVSRLLCPRRLDPSTDYIACVVPTFEVGRKAGLGIPILPAEEAKLEPAWPNPTNPAVAILPVFYSWEFRTGVGGDFEELVRRLEPRELPPQVGKRPMDVSDPGFRMNPEPDQSTPGGLIGMEGALRVLNTKPDAWAPNTAMPFQNALMPILNLPWKLATEAGTPGDPIVAPPVYGCWYSGKHTVTNVPPPPLMGIAGPIFVPLEWFNELNIDPRHRVAAGIGTQVIQAQQEELMSSAWAQMGAIQRINQRRRQAQLSRSLNDRILAKSFARMPEENFLRIVAPAQSRLVLAEGAPTAPTLTPLIGKLTGTVVPPTVVSPSMRKATRPRGAITKAFTQLQTTLPVGMIGFFNDFSSQPATPDRGGVSIDKISNALLATDPFRTQVRSTAITAATVTAAPGPGNLANFKAANIANQTYLAGLFPSFTASIVRKLVDSVSIKSLAIASLSPSKAVVNAVSVNLSIGSPPLLTPDPLEPVMDAPTFPQPMYAALRDLSQDYLLPGLEHVPPNTVQLLQTNAKFIESFMIGLNVEMGREMLWRDFPTDQRGTYFRQFWDTAAAGAATQLDIREPLHQWGSRALGTTAVVGGDRVVLLIRGELLRRYPNTVIYAVRAVGPVGARKLSTLPTDEVHPIFRGTLEPDLTFVGFPLSPADMTSTPGWFFVLQQQPTEPRFGMDDDPFGPGEDGKIPPLKTWNDLNWAHIGSTPAALKAITHVPVKKTTLVPTDKPPGVWGRNSAHMALITKQLPARVAIHASEMITPIVSAPKTSFGV